MQDKTENMKRLPEAVYSNFDHVLDEAVVASLSRNPNTTYAEHAAWNFCGYVWFDGTLWREQVWHYKHIVAELSNEDLSVLISDVNDKYGRA